MAGRYLYGDTTPINAPVLTAQAVEVGDLAGLSSGNVVRAQDETWVTDLATTQTNFVTKFLGVSAQRKVVNVARVDASSQDNIVQILTNGFFEMDSVAQTYNVGDLIGAAKQTGNALESQKVDKVATEARAIGRVTEKKTTTAADPRVKFRILSVQSPTARQS